MIGTTQNKSPGRGNPIQLIANKDYRKVTLELTPRELSCKSSRGLPTDLITNYNEIVCRDGRPSLSGSDFQSSSNQ